MQNSKGRDGNISQQTDVTSLTVSDVPSTTIIRRRIKYGSCESACKGMIMEYSKRTTIHGIRYLFEMHRPFYEKIVWLFLVATSFSCAVSLIWDTYLKWQDSPVVLGFDETLVPIHKIPFPTITICPETKKVSNAVHFRDVSGKLWQEIKQYGTFKNYANLTEQEISDFAASLHVCDADVVQGLAKYLPKNVESNVAETLYNIPYYTNDVIPFCWWKNVFYFFNDISTVVATNEGICYQFNGLHNKDIYRDERLISVKDDQGININNITGKWSLEDGFVGQGYNTYPQRSISASLRYGFYARLLEWADNIESACPSGRRGYKVFFNSPESVSVTNENYILVPRGKEAVVAVLPHYVVGSENLRYVKPEKRQCYFNDERYLRFFRYYSQINCKTECLVNYTISQCGCSKFWMPKPLEVPMCSLADITCYTKAEEDLKRKLLIQEMKKASDPNIEIMCDCMPACYSLEYNFEILNIPIDRRRFPKIESIGAKSSWLYVNFKTQQFTAIKRTVIFSTTTFISNCGGVFSLFMGISALSLIELIYFCSVRLFANLRKRRECRNKLLQQASLNNC